MLKPNPQLLRPFDAQDAPVTFFPTLSLPPASPTSSKVGSGKLFVGGLAWETTEDSLRSYFRQFGPVAFVLAKEGRGFGLVFFRHPKDAEAALAKAGQHIVDHKSVEYVLNCSLHSAADTITLF